MERYWRCVSLAGGHQWVSHVLVVGLGAQGSRLMEKPMAVPQATGSRMAAAAFSKRKRGRVREGM
jgi:hypothetical protein